MLAAIAFPLQNYRNYFNKLGISVSYALLIRADRRLP